MEVKRRYKVDGLLLVFCSDEMEPANLLNTAQRPSLRLLLFYLTTGLGGTRLPNAPYKEREPEK